jgi:hypothetical protein
LFDPNEQVVAYAFAEVHCERAQRAAVWTASDDTIAVWVNGRQVLKKDRPRGCFVDNERTEVQLAAGRNELLLKVGDYRAGWGFTCRVTDELGVPLTSLARAGR